MSSSDWGMESEDEEGGLPISSRQLDSSPEKSDSEGSGTAWVSSLGRHSRRKELSDLPHRAWPATAPRPRARAIGGQLAAARARTSAAALTAVATAAALSALRPASTATAAPTAVAPSDFHIAAAPAASAEALAEALAAALCALAPADALSAGRPTATAALSPAQPESAQALQADDGQLADAGEEAMAEVGSEQTMPVQASEADAARLRVVAPSDALSGLSLSSASPMTLGGDSTDPTAAAHQLADAQSAAQEEAVHSEGPLALDQESVQPTAAAAEQLADVQTAMLQSRRWAEDSCEEDWCVAEDYFSTPLPWKQPQQAKYSVESAVAASVEAAALVTQEETVGSDPGAELVNATMEGASQLGGMMFGTMTAADLLGVEGRQHMGSLGAASPTAPAIASASKAGVVAVHTAVASMGTNEDRLGAMAASAAEEGVSVSQFGGMMFGTITAADLLAASTHRADARLGASEDTLCTAAAGAAEGNASVSQLGGIRFGTITAADLLTASTHRADARLGASEDTLCTAAAGAAEGNASVSQLGGIRFGTITAADLLTASTYRADARLGASEDRLCTAAAGAAEHTDSRSQLSSSNHDSFRLTDTQTAVSHDGKEDCKEDEEEEAQVNTSLGYTAFVTDSLLNRMEQQAGNDGGHINVLDVRDNMDLVDMGGSDNQVYYNLALLEGINEQLAAASRKMQPPAPAMQQLTPLRRPPSTPRAIACAVHDDIMRSVHLAEASMPDGFKHSRLLAHDAKDHLKSVDEGTAGAEASIKIAIADSIFEDLIEDTALAFLDAHGLQEPPEPAVILET